MTALREYLQEAAHDDALTQEIAAAYYDGEISFEQLKALVGAEEAANLWVLKQQLVRLWRLLENLEDFASTILFVPAVSRYFFEDAFVDELVYRSRGSWLLDLE